jgi:aspartate dehydrogenase
MDIAIIGCGTIGGAVAEAVVTGRIAATLKMVVDTERTPALDSLIDSSKGRVKYCSRPEDLLDEKLDLVFEAASPKVVREHLLPLLRSGKDVMLMSIGGLADPELLKRAVDLAGNAGRKIILPSGAISGISTLKAASLAGELDSVTMRSTKAPAGLQGAPYLTERGLTLEGLQEKKLVFAGSVAEAVAAFPKNVNITAAVALAGLGVEKTRVEIYADPAAQVTRHSLSARGSFGEICLDLQSRPNPANPRSSYLATLGAISALQQYTQPLLMGL